MTQDAKLIEGARNLLVNCAGIETGTRLLIIHENPVLGWYDLEVPMTVAAETGKLGVTPTMIEVGAPDNERDARVADAISAHDTVIFFARIGDQDRFADPPPGKIMVMCYVRDRDMLASAFGTTTHQALVGIKNAVDDILLGANRIEIHCPLGTNMSGTLSQSAKAARVDVSVRRFPLGVPQPVDASGFSGQVALARFLTPTGSKVYEPASVEIEHPVFAKVESGRITGFAGDRGMVERISEHYGRVASLFGIDADVVHSWHAGIHPGCAFAADAAADPDLWSNTAFGNPRFLHFHTCGDYPPGEISWMVLDPTVIVNGQALWENGRLRAADFARSRRCFETWPELRSLFANPSDQIGLAE